MFNRNSDPFSLRVFSFHDLFNASLLSTISDKCTSWTVNETNVRRAEQILYMRVWYPFPSKWDRLVVNDVAP